MSQGDWVEETQVEEEAPLDLSRYWAVLVKHRLLIAVSAGLVLAAAMTSALLSTSLYKATAVLDVEKEKASPLDIGSGAQAIDYWGYNPEFLPTQTRLMRSREIVERVVRKLNLAKAQGKGLASGAGDVSKDGDAVAKAAMGYQAGIEVAPIRGTNLVELSFVADSPKLAADIANAVAEAYIDWSLESKYRAVGQASKFLGAQIEQMRTEVEEREQKLQAYGRSKDIVSVDPQSNITLQKLEALNRDYTQAVADRIGKEAKYYEVQTAAPETIADTLSNGLVSQLRNEQAKAEREYAEKLNLFKPEWPAMQQLKAQITKGKQHLDSVIQETVAKARDAAKSDYLTAQRREESLKEVLRTQKAEAQSLNSNAIEYNNLRIEVSTKRALLDTMLKRQSETEVMSRLGGSRESNIRIVDRALPPFSRFRPSYRRNAMLGVFLGLSLGVGLAFLLDYLDRSLRSTDQVEKLLRLAPLGVIPAVGQTSGKRYGYGYGYGYGRRRSKAKPEAVGDEKPSIELLPHLQPRSVVAEAYRSFRTSLLLSRAGGIRSVVITSAFPGEGKTTTALNLAVVLGQLGKKVLLIDADLHKPRLHEILKVSNRVGLVTILAEGGEIGKAVQATSVPGVSFLSAGPISPNPSGLLSSPSMHKALGEAYASFDYVVIDSPPVQAVADAILLGAMADGVVINVKGGTTPREHVARVRDRLNRANVTILGALINNLDERASGYGSYQYFGYRSEHGAYGYAYGASETLEAAGPAKGKAAKAVNL